jgi:hypothetical protein
VAFVGFFAVLLTSCGPGSGFVEAGYELAPESRLPRWFGEVSAKYDRKDLAVKVRFYSPIFPVDNVEVDLVDRSGRILSHATGRSFEHPVSQERRAKANDLPVFPHWDVVIVTGVMEVLEFKGRSNLVDVSDEPALVESAKEFIKRP